MTFLLFTPDEPDCQATKAKQDRNTKNKPQVKAKSQKESKSSSTFQYQQDFVERKGLCNIVFYKKICMVCVWFLNLSVPVGILQPPSCLMFMTMLEKRKLESSSEDLFFLLENLKFDLLAKNLKNLIPSNEDLFLLNN